MMGVAPCPPAARLRRKEAFPASAHLRYSEALSRQFDSRDPYGSLAKASLAEAAAYQRARHELDRAIATEADPARRDMLALRRDIEHADHMAQAHDRISGLARCVGGEAHDRQAAEQKERAIEYRQQAREARQEWEARVIDTPNLYPPLSEQMRDRQDAAHIAREHQAAYEQAQATEQERMPETRPALSSEAETAALRRIDLPIYAEQAHGYQVEYADDAHTRATLMRGDEALQATRADDGAWSYRNPNAAGDMGDIVKFEALRSGCTMGEAKANLRPHIEYQPQQHEAPRHKGQELEREQPDHSHERDEDDRER